MNQFDLSSNGFPVKKSFIYLIIFAILFVGSTFTIVGPGQRGVVVRLGQVTGKVFNEGLNFKMPIVDSVVKMDVKVQRFDIKNSQAASKDGQSVSTDISVNYSLQPEKVDEIYQTLSKGYEYNVIHPAVNEAIKQSTAKYDAVEILQNRAEVGDMMKNILQERLTQHNINVVAVSVNNLEFSESFDNALEAKQTAVQEALKAKNDLERVKFEAEQKIQYAKAEAESIRIQAQSIAQQGGENYVKLKAIEKWDGKLPTYSTSNGSGTFFNLPLSR
ncbi:prohibitin family protein [bacterium]|jgi:regulator of protease activity HflC (stomatin/prohibitin superfamily)|nr:prohibitin family protein [bacterium]MBT6293394.1 prohibitin family protein [bacterium]